MRCSAFVAATGIPVAETQAGKGALPFDHPSIARRDRGHRDTWRESDGARGRSGDRHRDALQRLHHGITHRLPATWTCGSSTSTSPSSTPSSKPAVRWWATHARRWRSWRRRSRGWSVDPGYAGRCGATEPGVGSARSSGSIRLGHQPAAEPGRDRRRGEPQRRARGCRGLRRGQPAGGPPQALADPRPQELSRRVRLLLHGLRGGRRARA